MNNISIVPYETKHQPFFERFNRQWIEELFEMEEVDEFVLRNPEKAIIQPGGVIIMAMYNTVVAGTVALRKINDQCYELTKMAVDHSFRRKGIASALMNAGIEQAIQLGASSVILYSNTKNAAAIQLYEKTGFKHLPVENDIYKRANVKMSFDLTTITIEH